MVCSHCNGVGHTYRRCPIITPEEKAAIKKKIKEKKDAVLRRRNLREQRTNIIRNVTENMAVRREQRVQILEPILYHVSNMTDHDIVLYYSNDTLKNNDNINQFCYISPHNDTSIKCVKSRHSIYVFPLIEVYDDSDRGNVLNKMKVSISSTGDIIYPHTCLLRLNLNEFEGENIIVDCDYTPKKTEIEQWRECALKSKFLLDQICMMTGGGKTMKAYENIEPFIDMIEDISVPECTELEKEKAGVPSVFTNIV
jgi:hypothetical protein